MAVCPGHCGSSWWLSAPECCSLYKPWWCEVEFAMIKPYVWPQGKASGPWESRPCPGRLPLPGEEADTSISGPSFPTADSFLALPLVPRAVRVIRPLPKPHPLPCQDSLCFPSCQTTKTLEEFIYTSSQLMRQFHEKQPQLAGTSSELWLLLLWSSSQHLLDI